MLEAVIQKFQCHAKIMKTAFFAALEPPPIAVVDSIGNLNIIDIVVTVFLEYCSKLIKSVSARVYHQYIFQ